MNRLIPLVIIGAGIAVSKMVTMVLGIGFEYGLLTSILVAAPLIVVEVMVIDRVPSEWKSCILLDKVPFPFFTLGVATGIVLMGRGVI